MRVLHDFVGIRMHAWIFDAWICSEVAWNTRRQYNGLTGVHSYLAKPRNKRHFSGHEMLLAMNFDCGGTLKRNGRDLGR